MKEFESNENNLIIGEHVVIKERSQLLSIEYEQLQKIKSLRNRKSNYRWRFMV